MNLTDKRVLFTADRAAQLIHSADTVDALIVMKAQSQNARDVAITWVNKGHTLDPWPLANPDARGEMLVDHRTADLCQQIHEEALLVQGQLEEARTVSRSVLHQKLLERWADGKNFEHHEIHRDELARWIVAAGIESGYAFAQVQEAVTPEPQAAPVAPKEQRQADRWQLCIDAGLSMPKDTYSYFPRGIGKVAAALKITRQALQQDLNAHRERLFGK